MQVNEQRPYDFDSVTLGEIKEALKKDLADLLGDYTHELCDSPRPEDDVKHILDGAAAILRLEEVLCLRQMINGAPVADEPVAAE